MTHFRKELKSVNKFKFVIKKRFFCETRKVLITSKQSRCMVSRKANKSEQRKTNSDISEYSSSAMVNM